jgi:hypothetical protein
MTTPTNSTAAQPIVSKPVASLTHAGVAFATITQAPDGTFGWRSVGRMTVKTKDGKETQRYGMRKGFADFQTAAAAAMVFCRRHGMKLDDAKIAVAEYVAPPKTHPFGQSMVDTPEFKAAAKVTAKLKMPAKVKATLAKAS